MWQQVTALSQITYTSQWGRNPVYHVDRESNVMICYEIIVDFLKLMELQGVHLAWLEFTARDPLLEGGESKSVFILNHDAWDYEQENEKEIEEALHVLNYDSVDSVSYDGAEGTYEGRLLLPLSKKQQNQLTTLRQLIPRTMSLNVIASTTAMLTCVGCPIPANEFSCHLPHLFSRRDIDGNPDMNWKISKQEKEENQILEFSDKQV